MSLEDKHKRHKISSDVLQMQFMRGTKKKLEERAKKEQLTAIENTYNGKQIPVPTATGDKSAYVFCPDIGFTELQNLRYGRLSFMGRNPEVERLMQEEELVRRRRNDPNFDDSEALFKDIPDVEMAQSSFGGLTTRYGGPAMVEPTDVILNCYTEESAAKYPEELKTSTDAPKTEAEKEENEQEEGELAPETKPNRFAPYKRPNRGRGGGRARKRGRK